MRSSVRARLPRQKKSCDWQECVNLTGNARLRRGVRTGIEGYQIVDRMENCSLKCGSSWVGSSARLKIWSRSVRDRCLTRVLFFQGFVFHKSKPPRGVAKLVSRLVWDQEIAGSSPVTSTNGNVDVAQLVEHCPEEAGVGGSNPSIHTALSHEGLFVEYLRLKYRYSQTWLQDETKQKNGNTTVKVREAAAELNRKHQQQTKSCFVRSPLKKRRSNVKVSYKRVRGDTKNFSYFKIDA